MIIKCEVFHSAKWLPNIEPERIVKVQGIGIVVWSNFFEERRGGREKKERPAIHERHY